MLKWNADTTFLVFGRNEQITFVTVLNPPEEYLDPSLPRGDGLKIIDLSGDVPGYTSNLSFPEIKQRILSSCKSPLISSKLQAFGMWGVSLGMGS